MSISQIAMNESNKYAEGYRLMQFAVFGRFVLVQWKMYRKMLHTRT